MTTLYDISKELVELDHALTLAGGEVDPDGLLERWFAELHSAKDAKLNGYCELIQEINARAVSRETESRRLADRATADNNAVDRLKNRLLDFCVVQNYRRINTGKFGLTVAQNGGKLPLVLPVTVEEIPAEFLDMVPTVNRQRIRNVLERGVELPFAHLGERGIHLRIT
jgi:hypothetical protein